MLLALIFGKITTRGTPNLEFQILSRKALWDFQHITLPYPLTSESILYHRDDVRQQLNKYSTMEMRSFGLSTPSDHNRR
jgi:hypothetical protein